MDFYVISVTKRKLQKEFYENYDILEMYFICQLLTHEQCYD